MLARLMGRRSARKPSKLEKNGIVMPAPPPMSKEIDVAPVAGLDIVKATPVTDVGGPVKGENNVIVAEVSTEVLNATSHESKKEVLCSSEVAQKDTNEVVESQPENQNRDLETKIGNIPFLRDVPSSDRQEFLIKKLNLCCIIYDFSTSKYNAEEKEIKRQILLELLDYIQCGGNKFTERVHGEIVKMIATNLFRPLPPTIHETTGHGKFDREEEDNSMDPAWPHLQIVYELLLRYIMSSDTDPKVAKRYIDRYFVQRFLDLFESEDPRERDCAKTILHRVYGKYMMHRPFIRKTIGNIFYRFIYETENYNGISELLEILGSIINGFALPLKEEHKLFLSKILMPLHKSKYLSLYHQQLSYCVTQYVQKDDSLVDTAIRGLLKYWPVTNSQKEILFLQEIEEILEITEPSAFQCCMVPLFRQISRCLNCTHFQVAERTLFFWSNDHIANLIAENRNVILPLIFEALEKNTASHWHQGIHGLTMNIKQMFLELDENLFKQCQLKFQEDEVKANESRQKRQAIWKSLEESTDSCNIISEKRT